MWLRAVQTCRMATDQQQAHVTPPLEQTRAALRGLSHLIRLGSEHMSNWAMSHDATSHSLSENQMIVRRFEQQA